MTISLSPHILEILASKICHDLISPIGAINNGIEFMQEMGAEAMDDAADLISLSATKATAHLQAYRLFYGAGGADSVHKPSDVKAVIDSIIGKDGKITQNWDPTVIPMGAMGYKSGFCKVLTGLLLLSLYALPRGGEITLEYDADSEITRLTASGRDGGLRPGHKNALMLHTEESALGTADVLPYICGIFGQKYDINIVIENETAGAETNTVTFAIS